MVLLKIMLILSLFVLLLKLQIPLPITLFAAGLLTSLLYMISPLGIYSSMLSTLKDRNVWEVFFAIYFVLLLSRVFQKFNVFPPVFSFLNSRIRDKRMIVPFFPAIIGLLPMLGGAVFSAPFVEESSRGLIMTKEQKTFFNYWFRHIWEYFFPLYSGIQLLFKFLEVPVWMIVKHQWYMTPIAFFIGFVYLFSTVRHDSETSDPDRVSPGKLSDMFIAFLPFMIILAGAFVEKLNFVFLIIIASVPYSAWLARKNRYSLTLLMKKAFSFKMLFLILAVFFLKRIIEFSGLATEFQAYAIEGGFHPLILLFLLPFLIGLLTGVTNAYVGICIPLLLPFLGKGDTVNYQYVLFAYTSGFCGVLLSPVHLCFLLTNEFFGSRLHRVYPPVFAGAAILIGGCLCVTLLLGP